MMSFCVSSQTITALSLFAQEGEDVEQQQIDSSLPDKASQGELKSGNTSTRFSSVVTSASKEIVKTTECVHERLSLAISPKHAREKMSPMQLVLTTHTQRAISQQKTESPNAATLSKGSEKQSEFTPSKSAQLPNQTPNHRQSVEQKSSMPHTKSTEHSQHPKLLGQEKKEWHQQSKIQNPQHKSADPCFARKWSREQTNQWWETRYTQKERQGGGEQEQHQQEQHEEEEGWKLSKSSSVDSNRHSKSSESYRVGLDKPKKPRLAPPKLGVFALYYILTKMGISSDGASNFSYKREIEYVDEKTTEAHRQRLEEMREAIKKEEENARWTIASKAFSWIGSFFGIMAGVALIATGVGVVAGAMLIIGGTIQLANEILELSGGWKKIGELLPGDDPEKKRAVVSWMQIGIAVLCLILSGAGVIWGGFTAFGSAMQSAMAIIGGIAAMGHGVTTIGEGMSGFMYKDKLGDIKKYDIRLAKLKHKRQDLMDQVEWGANRLEQLFEDLAKALEFEIELFRADQMVNRR